MPVRISATRRSFLLFPAACGFLLLQSSPLHATETRRTRGTRPKSVEENRDLPFDSSGNSFGSRPRRLQMQDQPNNQWWTTGDGNANMNNNSNNNNMRRPPAPSPTRPPNNNNMNWADNNSPQNMMDWYDNRMYQTPSPTVNRMHWNGNMMFQTPSPTVNRMYGRPPALQRPPTRPPRRTTMRPTTRPTMTPTWPTRTPTWPTRPPIARPTPEPTRRPTTPTRLPTWPTRMPITWPTQEPTRSPTTPTRMPTSPTPGPTNRSTRKPTREPTATVLQAPKESTEESSCVPAIEILCSDLEAPTTVFCNIIEAFGLEGLLDPDDGSGITVFAPTDLAFSKIDNIKLSPDELEEVFLYHIATSASDPLTFDDLRCTGLVLALNGKSSRTKCEDNDATKFQKGAGNDEILPKIVAADLKACGGVIVHLVDNVILPKLPEGIVVEVEIESEPIPEPTEEVPPETASPSPNPTEAPTDFVTSIDSDVEFFGNETFGNETEDFEFAVTEEPTRSPTEEPVEVVEESVELPTVSTTEPPMEVPVDEAVVETQAPSAMPTYLGTYFGTSGDYFYYTGTWDPAWTWYPTVADEDEEFDMTWNPAWTWYPTIAEEETDLP